MATELGVSRPTIYKEMKRHNIDYVGKFTNHSNEDLKVAMTRIKENHPNAGEVMVRGHLQSQGIVVQRKRLRETLKEVDPVGTQERKRLKIKRRVYSVPCPNYIWHIDGNHKLIRWKIVLHHGIDGYSRLVVFGRFNDNNYASTVHQLFSDAVHKYRHPFRVRTDYGGENVEVWHDMVSKWGENSGAVVVGSSIHNQRIERHNRSVNENVIEKYKSIFYEMEAEGILNPDNLTDIFCLHYVFLPKLNHDLMEFIAAHNNHPVSTEHNETPSQLFFLNLNLTAIRSGLSPEEAQNGIRVTDFLQHNQLPHVELSHVRNPLDVESFQELQRAIDPLSQPDGKAIFKQTIQFVGDKLFSN